MNFDWTVAQIDAGLSPRHIQVPEYKEPEEIPSTTTFPGSVLDQEIPSFISIHTCTFILWHYWYSRYELSIGSFVKNFHLKNSFLTVYWPGTCLCVFRSPRKEETMKTAKTMGSRVLSKDEFQAHATARFEKVMRKLNSATVS